MSIYIINNKEEYLKTRKNLSNDKLMTINELKKNLYFNYNNDAIIYLMNKYNYNYQVAKIMIENMYYIKEATNNKVNKLIKLKEELIENKLLIKNKLFEKYIVNQNIVFDNKLISNDLEILRKQTNGVIKEYPQCNYNHLIHMLKDQEEEVTFIANEICNLISNGIDINNIYITNINDEYRKIISKIFKLFKIPVNLKKDTSIISNTITNKFIETNFDINVLKDNEVSEKLISIMNKYINIDHNNIKELIINDIKNTKLKTPILKNAINEIEFTSKNINDQEYLFILGFNQGEFPTISKDELYLNDKELKSIELLTSNELNKLKNNIYTNIIKNTKNTIITSKEINNGNEAYISSLNDILQYEIKKETKKEYNYSNKYNVIELAKYYEKYKKYGTLDNDLLKLLHNYQDIKLNTYNNQFSGIEKDSLKAYLKGKYNLSYSSMDNYYKCAFKYYLNNILRLTPYEETFPTILGNIFHRILENTMNKNQSLDELWSKEEQIINKLNKKDQFFINYLKKELIDIIETLKNYQSLSEFNQSLYEEKIEVPYNGYMDVTFKGFVDKINYLEEQEQTLVSIIDYKTGSAEINLNNIEHGIGMQLPIYIYLAKRSQVIKNARIAGIYIHQLLEKPYHNDGKKIIEKKIKALKLKGYTNQDQDVIKKLDSSYNNSQMINNLKTTANGFYQHAKLLNDQDFEKLNNIAEQKINEAINNINGANFQINPKKDDKTIDGCMYCKYQGICYKNESNYIKIEKTSGGEENAKMD